MDASLVSVYDQLILQYRTHFAKDKNILLKNHTNNDIL